MAKSRNRELWQQHFNEGGNWKYIPPRTVHKELQAFPIKMLNGLSWVFSQGVFGKRTVDAGGSHTEGEMELKPQGE